MPRKWHLVVVVLFLRFAWFQQSDEQHVIQDTWIHSEKIFQRTQRGNEQSGQSRQECRILSSLCTSGKHGHSNQIISLLRLLVYAHQFTNCQVVIPQMCQDEWTTENVPVADYYDILHPHLTLAESLAKPIAESLAEGIACYIDDRSLQIEATYPTSFNCSTMFPISATHAIDPQGLVGIPFPWRLPLVFDKFEWRIATAPFSVYRNYIGLQPWLLQVLEQIKQLTLGNASYTAVHIRLGDMTTICPKLLEDGRTHMCGVDKTQLITYLLQHIQPNVTMVIGGDATDLELTEIIHQLQTNLTFPLQHIIWKRVMSTKAIQKILQATPSNIPLDKHLHVLSTIIDQAIYGCAHRFISTFYSSFSSQARVVPWQICPQQVEKHHKNVFLIPGLTKISKLV
jgi:hypothetical protein